MYNDTIMLLEELLVKDKTFAIYHQNIQALAIEMYEKNNLPRGNLSEFFVRNIHSYNLRSRSELTVARINTIFKVQQNSISYFGSVIWNSISAKLRGINSFQFSIWK